MRITLIMSVIFSYAFSAAIAQGNEKYISVQLPNDFSGHTPEGAYSIYLDSVETHNGHKVATIKSLKPSGFATILSSAIPEKCIGKRIEYTAHVRSENVKGWAGLWLRIDPADVYKDPCLGFENMSDRPIKGSSKWTKYRIVLDVPKGAADLVYGILLDGDGQVWLDNVNLKIVDKSVPLTTNKKVL